jgi:hypothetical protein
MRAQIGFSEEALHCFAEVVEIENAISWLICRLIGLRGDFFGAVLCISIIYSLDFQFAVHLWRRTQRASVGLLNYCIRMQRKLILTL